MYIDISVTNLELKGARLMYICGSRNVAKLQKKKKVGSVLGGFFDKKKLWRSVN
jgi:hypothetical protein